MTIVSQDILSRTVESGRTRLIFRFVLDDGSIIGPRVADRDAKEDLQKFVDLQAQALQQSLDVPPPDPEEQLRELVLSQPDSVIKLALKIDDAKLAEVKAAKVVDDGAAIVVTP